MKSKFNFNIRYVLLALALLVVYIIAGKFGLSMAYYNKSASPIWIPTGLAMAALLLFGYRFWPSVAIGAFLVNITTTPSIPVSLGISLGNTLESLAGVYLINRFANGADLFKKVKTYFTFFLIACLVPLISAIVGVTSLSIGNFAQVENLWVIGTTWWIGDVIGALLVLPLIVTLYNKPQLKIKKERYLEILLATFILIVIALIIFMGWPIQINKAYRIGFLCLPPLLWISFRSCLRISIITTVLTSAIAIAGTILNIGVFNIGSINTALVLVQLFIGVLTVTVISVSVIAIEYKKVVSQTNARIS